MTYQLCIVGKIQTKRQHKHALLIAIQQIIQKKVIVTPTSIKTRNVEVGPDFKSRRGFIDYEDVIHFIHETISRSLSVFTILLT